MASSEPAAMWGSLTGGELLQRIAGDTRVPSRSLRSFKVSETEVQWDRLIVSLHHRMLASDGINILEMARSAWAMPAEVHRRTLQLLEVHDLVSFVHLGREAAGSAEVYKIYLEIDPAVDVRSRGLEVPPHTSHLAFKWRPSHLAGFLTCHYQRLPELALIPAHKLVDEYLGTDTGPWSRLARGLVDERLQTETAAVDDVLLVTEVETSRRSVDLKIPSSCSSVFAEGALSRWLSVERTIPSQVKRQLERANAPAVVRLAMGRSRAGERFVTLYFRVEDSPQAARAGEGPVVRSVSEAAVQG